MSDRVVLLGASVRAAAFSALRAGLRPWCVDLFADADLGARCTAQRLSGRYPAGFLDVIDHAGAGPWLYTGGLENHPEQIAQLARRRPLWGNDRSVLCLARDPALLTLLAHQAGLPAPTVSFTPTSLPGPWLLKPRRGAGGTGIRPWTADLGGPGPEEYLQQHIQGMPAAVLYLGAAGQARLLGVTRQLVGEPWLFATPFRYCGSLGPWRVDSTLQLRLAELGHLLVATTGLTGLFGIDGILHDDAFWPVELNPRYTASVEVLEYATGLPALTLHRLACTEPAQALSFPLPEPGAVLVAKAIVHAPCDVRFPVSGPWEATLRLPGPVGDRPDFADIPHANEELRRGRPILTVLTQASHVREAEELLRQRVAEVLRWLIP